MLEELKFERDQNIGDMSTQKQTLPCHLLNVLLAIVAHSKILLVLLLTIAIQIEREFYVENAKKDIFKV